LGWVNTTTTAVNGTLNAFVDEMVGALNTTFGGTVLYEPILDVLNCLVILKIKGIENGLTWVKDHAHVDFPLLNNDTFSLGAIQKVSGSTTDLLATGPNGTAADAITRAVAHVINGIAKAIRQEAIISTCVLLIWVLIALIGVGRSVYVYFKGGRDIDPNHADPQFGEKHQLDDFQPAPTYEQATGTPHLGDHDANKYNGHSYTLTPAPLPTFNVNPATSPILNTGFCPPQAEKIHNVNGQHVDTATRRPTHIRASSHGDYAVTSPVSPIIANPFLSPSEARIRK